MADKTQNVKTRLSFDGEAEYKAACKEINSTLKVLNSEMKLVPPALLSAHLRCLHCPYIQPLQVSFQNQVL